MMSLSETMKYRSEGRENYGKAADKTKAEMLKMIEKCDQSGDVMLRKPRKDAIDKAVRYPDLIWRDLGYIAVSADQKYTDYVKETKTERYSYQSGYSGTVTVTGEGKASVSLSPEYSSGSYTYATYAPTEKTFQLSRYIKVVPKGSLAVEKNKEQKFLSKCSPFYQIMNGAKTDGEVDKQKLSLYDLLLVLVFLLSSSVTGVWVAIPLLVIAHRLYRKHIMPYRDNLNFFSEPKTLGLRTAATVGVVLGCTASVCHVVALFVKELAFLSFLSFGVGLYGSVCFVISLVALLGQFHFRVLDRRHTERKAMNESGEYKEFYRLFKSIHQASQKSILRNCAKGTKLQLIEGPCVLGSNDEYEENLGYRPTHSKRTAPKSMRKKTEETTVKMEDAHFYDDRLFRKRIRIAKKLMMTWIEYGEIDGYTQEEMEERLEKIRAVLSTADGMQKDEIWQGTKELDDVQFTMLIFMEMDDDEWDSLC